MTTLTLFAQLSPGKLHEVHKDLEGIENCLKCHTQGKKGINPEKCLKCHILLKQEIHEKKGFHGKKDTKKCEKCHIEHVGRDSKLIYWKDGKDRFDHSVTGYILKGKHKKLACEKCHNPRYIQNKDKLIKNKKDLNTTYLGLSLNCNSCHQDEHRGQVGTNCQSCHNEEEWRKAPLFDHQKTDFRLNGKHRKVKCQKCHKKIIDNKYKDNPDYLWFKPVKHKKCSNCHEDIHKGKLGKRCSHCHSTQGWNIRKNKEFDHSKTAFPLIGKHRSVQCNQCHIPGKKITNLKFEKCYDCHSDYHQGQLVKNGIRRDCSECHSETGFSPSTFTLENHSKTDYPLQGSHKAVPCILCHRKIQSQGRETNQFTFESYKCIACHENVHKKQVDTWMRKGCQSCHEVEGWEIIRGFDHSKTKFILTGKHEKVKCKECHVSPDNKLWGPVYFKNNKSACVDCHDDIHNDQFQVTTNKKVNCERCHQTDGWKNIIFDHNKDSRFPLKGKHRNVLCEKCHPIQEINGKRVRIYKPLKIECKNCHGNIEKL
jgi:hypothetical protein